MNTKGKKLYPAFSSDALGLYVIFARNKPEASDIAQQTFGVIINPDKFQKTGAFGYEILVTKNILEFVANTHRIQHNGIESSPK